MTDFKQLRRDPGTQFAAPMTHFEQEWKGLLPAVSDTDTRVERGS
jgi:hypothetical protein